ncbi:hypothetical protein [Duncaniella freteri]|jgi:hypothetical protein|uniref:Uncharacterized protein n=3 Tax=Duncaniella TaxID=2518495 RepID=A0A4Z0V7U5_9BACT|nr:hypothetical protein [Duncaniella freteri]MDE7027330.1 hypothetical protein [Duncaniella freteri]TGG39793.1 hypothetical protein EZ315_03400 [Duncaniella freteri]
MTRKETRFTNFIRSRGVGAIIAVVSAWMTWRALPSLTPSGWLGFMPELSWGVNFAVLSATAWAMIAINRQFNILRTLSVFFAAYFLFITCSTPFMSCFAGTSSVLAACMIFCMWILFTLYNEPHSNRRIFLIFAILSVGTLYDWKFLFFIPLFVIGLAQMRILRTKKIIAALIGIFTPPWIVFGLDLMPIPQLPHIFFTPPTILLQSPEALPFLCTVLLTMAIGFLLGSINLLRILGFNARARAYNGFLALLGIYTGILAIINFTALPDYMTLLNACVAFQVGHFFRATASRRGYILIVLLFAAYTSLYLWANLK